MELIDRQEVLSILRVLGCFANPKCLDGIRKQVKELPTVDAVPVVHGRWLSACEYGLKLGITDAEALERLKEDKWWKFCKDCGEGVKGSHNYCPNCGAKMDGGAEDGC